MNIKTLQEPWTILAERMDNFRGRKKRHVERKRKMKNRVNVLFFIVPALFCSFVHFQCNNYHSSHFLSFTFVQTGADIAQAITAFVT